MESEAPVGTGERAQRADGEETAIKRQQKPRRNQGQPQGPPLEFKESGGEVGRPG